MKIKKEYGRMISRDELARLRKRAIELRNKGWQVNDIADSFGLNRGSVSRWFTRFRRHGEAGIIRRKATGAKPKLTLKETQNLLDCIRKSAMRYGFATPLWDCRRVQQLIKQRFDKMMNPSSVWYMLRRWNFTSQKPEKHAVEQVKGAITNWLANEWPKIQSHVKQWRAILYFQDEAGVSLIPVLGKTWAPRGQTPHVTVTGKRGGITVTSAIGASGRFLFRIEKKRVNAKLHREFLQQILDHHPRRKIIVIEDRAPVHRAASVQDFVQQHQKRFALYYLPSYSPELNPDEKTWRHLKNQELKAHQSTSVPELRKLVLAKMKSMQRRPKLIKFFFKKSYVT